MRLSSRKHLAGTPSRFASSASCAIHLVPHPPRPTQFFGYMPDYFLDHGLNQSWVGGGSALGFGTSFFCTVFAVWLSQRIPSTTLLPVALLLSAAAQILMGLIGQHLTGTALGVFFLGMRMVMGLADGFIQVSALSHVMMRASRSAPSFAFSSHLPQHSPRALQVTAMGSILRILPESQVPVAIGGVETVRAITSLAAPIFGTSLFTINGAGTENIAMPFAIAGAMMACCFVLVATTVWFAPSGFGRSLPAAYPPDHPPSIVIATVLSCRVAWVGAPHPLSLLLATRSRPIFHERSHFSFQHSPLKRTTRLTFPPTSLHWPRIFPFCSSATPPSPPSPHPPLTPLPHSLLTLPSQATRR